MADTMIERMALALADEFTRQAKIGVHYADTSNLDYVTLDGTFDLKQAMLVILGGMREPTGKMIDAGYGDTKGDPDHSGCSDNPLPDDSWPRMIDAAIGEVS